MSGLSSLDSFRDGRQVAVVIYISDGDQSLNNVDTVFLNLWSHTLETDSHQAPLTFYHVKSDKPTDLLNFYFVCQIFCRKIRGLECLEYNFTYHIYRIEAFRD